MKKIYKNKIEIGYYDKEILHYISNGYTYSKIKEQTGYSLYLISQCVKNMYNKFNARNHISLIYKTLKARYFTFKRIS